VYAHEVAAALGGAGLPTAASEAAGRSLAGALTVARDVGGDAGAGIARAANDAFVAGMHRGVVIGALAVAAAAVSALVFLPARARAASDPIVTDDFGVSETGFDDFEPAGIIA
jgi:MFS transporter, DHA2 family, multidrug resistance protein